MKNPYLEKIALRRAIVEFAKGKLSHSAEHLSHLGVIKPDHVYAQGMARGNANIAKKLGVTIKRPSNEFEQFSAKSGGGYSATVGRDGKSGTVLAPRTGNGSNNMHHGAVRHELFEVSDGQKLFHRADRQISQESQQHAAEALHQDLGIPKDQIADHFHHHKPLKHQAFTLDNKHVGTHMSPRVLARESEMVRKNPYLQKIKHLRDETGEADTVHKITGKWFGEQKMTGKDFKKALNAHGNSHHEPEVHGQHNTVRD